MAVTNLSNVNATGLNLVTGATVDTYTTTADGWVCGTLYISGLNAAASTLTVKVLILDASDVQLGVPVAYSMAKDAAANTTAVRVWGPVRVRSGEKVRVTLSSTNASDTTNPAARSIIDDAFAADATYWQGVATATSGTSGSITATRGATLLSGGTGSAQVNASGGVVQSDVALWRGTQPLALTSQLVQVDVERVLQTTEGASGLQSMGAYYDLNAVVPATGNWYTGTPPTTSQIAAAILTNTANTLSPAPSAAANAAAVWGDTRANYTTNGTFGKVSEWAGAIDESTVASAVWNATRSSYTTAGSFGKTSEWVSSSSANVTITPLSATVSAGEVTGDYFVAYQNQTATITIVVTDENGTAVNLNGKTVRFTASAPNTPNTAIIDHDNSSVGGLTISGGSYNNVQVTLSGTDTATPRDLVWAVWNVTDDKPVASGRCAIITISQKV